MNDILESEYFIMEEMNFKMVRRPCCTQSFPFSSPKTSRSNRIDHPPAAPAQIVYHPYRALTQFTSDAVMSLNFLENAWYVRPTAQSSWRQLMSGTRPRGWCTQVSGERLLSHGRDADVSAPHRGAGGDDDDRPQGRREPTTMARHAQRRHERGSRVCGVWLASAQCLWLGWCRCGWCWRRCWICT